MCAATAQPKQGVNFMKQGFELAIPRVLEEICEPKRTALLVYNMQVGIINQLKDGAELTAKVIPVLEAAREAGVRVFFARHLSLPKEIMGVFQMRQTMAWQHVTDPSQVNPWFLRDTPGFQIIPEIVPLPSEVIFDKIAVSAFEGTFLNVALRDCGIHSLIIIGAVMEIGIEPTARHATDLGYIPVVVTDACGAGDKEAAKRSVANLEFAGDALLTNAETICNLFTRQPVAAY
jgi:nicotinamidase-related amidase